MKTGLAPSISGIEWSHERGGGNSVDSWNITSNSLSFIIWHAKAIFIIKADLSCPSSTPLNACTCMPICQRGYTYISLSPRLLRLFFGSSQGTGSREFRLIYHVHHLPLWMHVHVCLWMHVHIHLPVSSSHSLVLQQFPRHRPRYDVALDLWKWARFCRVMHVLAPG